MVSMMEIIFSVRHHQRIGPSVVSLAQVSMNSISPSLTVCAMLVSMEVSVQVT
jgi:hypothetical protein